MKMKTIQRAFAWALTLVMVLSAAPLGVFAEGEEGQMCSCTVKCGETAKEDCPVCGGESGDPAACVGKTQEELDAEAAAKLAAEEEARKAAEAAQKAAKEEENPPAKVELKKSEDLTDGTGDNIAPASDDDKNLNDTVETVEVSFVTNEAEETIEPMTVAKGGALGEQLPTPRKSGHTFEGWYKDQDCKGDKVTGETTFDVNTILYAKWTATNPTPDTGNQVTVKFDANGGTVNPSSMIVEKGDTLSGRLLTPGRDGYTFEGWYKNKDCTGDKVTDGTLFGEDITLYAKWTATDPTPDTGNQVTITFDANGGTVAPSSMTVEKGETLDSRMPTPSKSGHNFEGWYMDQNFTEENKVTNGTKFEDNTILYAKWTAITPPEPKPETGVTVTFKFQLDGVTDETRKTNAEGMLEEELPQPSKDGFDFLGWYLKSEDSEEQVVANKTVFKEDTTVYAKWKQQPEAVAVTFDAKGGICAVTSAKVNANKKLDSLPNPTREGYTFLGWYIQGTETKVTVETPYETSTTLEARWEKVVSVEKTEGIIPGEDFLKGIPLNEGTEKVKIVVNEGNKEEAEKSLANVLGDRKLLAVYDLSVQMLDQNGGSLGAIPTVNGLIQFDFTVDREVVAVYHNTTPMEPSDGTTEGYRYSNGILTIWAKSFSPYAIVVNPVAVTVTFDPMGGTVAPKTMTTGTDGKLKDALPTPTRTGYTFDGWYSDKNHTGNKMTQDVTFLRDSTLYAKWTPKTYTVTFHDNYNDPEVTSKQTFTYDVAQSLDCGSTIRRDYYTLSGWAETSGGPKKFAPTETVQSLIPEGNKDLYALWTYEPRRVTFDADGGKIKKDGAEVDKVTVNTQEAPINTVKAADVPVPELREGYYFGGWYTRKDGKGDLVKTGETKEPTVFTTDATVYAYWVEFEPVTVTFKCQGGTARIGTTDVKEFTMQTKWPGVLDGTPSTPGRSGYKFEGWYTAAGVKVDADTLFLRNSTVYAHWRRAVSSTGNPRTGDQVKLEAAIAILAAAAIGLGATVVLKKRKEK